MGGEAAALEGVRDHGGSLARARALFPHAPKPWIDCSTGINPHSYPVPPLPQSAWERLPEEAEVDALRAGAAAAYGAPGREHVAAAPGTQILLPLVAALVEPGRACVLGPTYAEHARCAALAGHSVEDISGLDALATADLAILVNPNNPDGKLHTPVELLDLARRLEGRGGLLVVDEAFMDVAPEGYGLAPHLGEAPNLVVLRSFGKFFGLAGLRLGFALAHPRLVARLDASLGPWAVSGPALAIGRSALADAAWQGAMRARLAGEAARLDAVLAGAGLGAPSGTSLFRFVRTPDAQGLFRRLGQGGVYVRRFDAMPCALRFGLPPDEEGLARIGKALAGRRGAPA